MRQLIAKAAAFIATIACLDATAATKRALIVGINDYIKPGYDGVSQWKPTTLRPQILTGVFPLLSASDHSLSGAKFDALAFEELLIGTYGFNRPKNSPDDDVQVLLDGQATADAILTKLKSHLIDKAQPGDISVFYFAGHGSQIRNKSTEKPQGLDVSIVPADYFLGVPAIRDKELVRIYRQVRDGVNFTVIQDNCYSGGGARGGPAMNRRELDVDPRTIDDPPDRDKTSNRLLPPPDQQANPVLVLAAAQATEPALEKYMRTESRTRGVFTYALIEALKETPNERIDLVFRKLRAKMQDDTQQPVVLARDRLQKDLLGNPAVPSTAIVASVSKIQGRTIQFHGGVASGIRVGCELRKIWPGRDAHAALRIKVTNTKDLDQSTGEIIGRYEPEDIAERDTFRLYSWPSNEESLLTFYTAGGTLDATAIAGLAEMAKKEATDVGLTWVTDPTQQDPDWTVRWNGQTWELYGRTLNGKRVDLGALPPKALSSHIVGASRGLLLFEAPPPQALLSTIALGEGDTAGLGVIHTEPASADYVLTGVLGNKGLRYAWRRPDRSASDISRLFDAARTQAASENDGASSIPWKLMLPLMSESTTLEDVAKAGAVLREGAQRLARPAGWASLASPAGADVTFPYQLVLKNAKTGQEAGREDLREGDRYQLFLRAPPVSIETARKAMGKNLDPAKYVYVGGIDSSGQGVLLYPEPGQRNRLPAVDPPKTGLPQFPPWFPLTRRDYDLEIAPPFGIDHYYVLISATPLSAPEVLEFQGAYQPEVESRRGGGDEDALSKLLRNTGNTRGLKGPDSPGDWAVQHYYFRSVGKGK